MRIISEERSTGMCATKYAAIFRNGRWTRIGALYEARYEGRFNGVEKHTLEVPDDTCWAQFYRSNSGLESVVVYEGTDEIGNFSSFEAADEFGWKRDAEIVIVTRHEGLVKWLALRGITGEVVSHAAPYDVGQKHVVGNLPLHLAVLAYTVTTIDMPDLPADKRGVDLTPTEMDSYGARMTTYQVTKVVR